MIMNNIFHFTFALAAALMSGPGAVSAYTSDYDRGYSEGQQKAKNIWKNKDGGNCAYISKFEDQVDDFIRTHYWYRSSDYYATQSFDKGAQSGMKRVLQQYQTQCHNDHHDNDNVNVDTGMCSGLGKDAASEIAEKYAEDHCPNYSRPVTSIFQKKYKEECFEIGLDDCKGAINDEVYLYCGRYIDDYSVLKGLKFKCGYKVSGYIDDSLH
mmetsp:Transcript_20636/g.31855  ORF Transcript_20636/g.31855 Transcript_20636/m.31855 type:complete len:211 (-) Transcript_20636:104-736(-)